MGIRDRILAMDEKDVVVHIVPYAKDSFKGSYIILIS